MLPIYNIKKKQPNLANKLAKKGDNNKNINSKKEAEKRLT